MADYPLGPKKSFQTNVLYDIVRCLSDYQELELHAMALSASYTTIQMQRGWIGGWKIHCDSDGTATLLFRTTPDWSKAQDGGNRWVTGEGKLLAMSGLEAAIRGKEAGIPTLTLERSWNCTFRIFLSDC